MYEERIKYTNLKGEEKEKVAYFHFSKAELVEMQVSEAGGLDKMIKEIVDSKDMAKIVAIFKMLILRAYGEVSDDGESFIKDPELTKKFEKTEAYSELFMSLVADTDKAVAFITGIMPNVDGIQDKIDAEIAKIKEEENKVVSIEEK